MTFVFENVPAPENPKTSWLACYSALAALEVWFITWICVRVWMRFPNRKRVLLDPFTAKEPDGWEQLTEQSTSVLREAAPVRGSGPTPPPPPPMSS
jgi:hypothetical protein